MKKTWKPIAAGIMGIVVGGLQIPYTILTLIGSVLEEGFSVPSCILFTMKALFAFFAIAGGVNHLRRARWPLAMAGSISVFFCFAQFLFPRLISWSWSDIYWIEVVLLLPGIAAIVLTILSKREFG